jgi:hypothetical protein
MTYVGTGDPDGLSPALLKLQEGDQHGGAGKLLCS